MPEEAEVQVLNTATTENQAPRRRRVSEKQLASLKRWEKGVSGNPTGLSKERYAAKRAFDPYRDECVAKAMELIREGNQPMLQRALEYQLGKPKEQIEHTLNVSEELKQIASASLLLRVKELQAKERELKANVVDALPSVVDSAHE